MLATIYLEIFVNFSNICLRSLFFFFLLNFIEIHKRISCMNERNVIAFLVTQKPAMREGKDRKEKF